MFLSALRPFDTAAECSAVQFISLRGVISVCRYAVQGIHVLILVYVGAGNSRYPGMYILEYTGGTRRYMDCYLEMIAHTYLYT